jgi:hypothetical protein
VPWGGLAATVGLLLGGGASGPRPSGALAPSPMGHSALTRIVATAYRWFGDRSGNAKTEGEGRTPGPSELPRVSPPASVEP